MFILNVDVGHMNEFGEFISDSKSDNIDPANDYFNCSSARNSFQISPAEADKGDLLRQVILRVIMLTDVLQMHQGGQIECLGFIGLS